MFYHFSAYKVLSSGHECIKLENRRFGVFWTSYRTFFFINDVWPAVCLLFRGAARRGQNLMNPCTFSCLLWWRGCESKFFAVFILCWAMLSSSLIVIWKTNNDTIMWVREHDMVKSSDFSRFGGYPCSTPFGVMTKRGITEISKIWDLKTSLKRCDIKKSMNVDKKYPMLKTSG